MYIGLKYYGMMSNALRSIWGGWCGKRETNLECLQTKVLSLVFIFSSEVVDRCLKDQSGKKLLTHSSYTTVHVQV